MADFPSGPAFKCMWMGLPHVVQFAILLLVSACTGLEPFGRYISVFCSLDI